MTKQLSFGSLFSGVGGFDLGFARAGMRCAWQVEINSQCRDVSEHRFPGVRRIDDVNRLRAYMETKNAERFAATRPVRADLICGGFPCQDLSVAGRRAGLAGSRSGLWFTFRRIIALERPRWVCIENVPGLLSSNDGRDMGIILGALADLGYGYAYRVLDAQWFGVAQRRERVFIVGCLGGVRRAAQVLLESDCLPWDSPPSREAGAGVTNAITRGLGSGGADDNKAQGGHLVAFGGNDTRGAIDVATACNAKGGSGRHDFESETFVTHTLRAEGFDASEDGTGRGTPIVPVPIKYARGATGNGAKRNAINGPANGPMFPLEAMHEHAVGFQCHGSNVGPMGALRAGNGNESGGVPFTVDTLNSKGIMHTKENRHACSQEADAGTLLSRLRKEIGKEAFAQWGLGILDSFQPATLLQQEVLCDRKHRPKEGETKMVGCASPSEDYLPQGTLREVRQTGRERRRPQGWRLEQQLADELATYLSKLPHEKASPSETVRGLWAASEGIGVLRQALSAIQEVGRSACDQAEPAPTTYGVRRLTPREAERLQGFPDDWTRYGAEAGEMKDGPRYRMLGNAVNAKVSEWIARRIVAADMTGG